MRIIVAHKYYYRRAGAERYVFDVSDLLRTQGHEVIPFAMHHPDNESSEYDEYFVPYIETRFPQGLWNVGRIVAGMTYSYAAKWRFAELVAAVKPDMVYIHNIYHQISPSILDVCRSERIPVVQMVHDYHLICPNYKLFKEGRVFEGCARGYWRDIEMSSVRGFLKSIGEVAGVYVQWWRKSYLRGVDVWLAPSAFTAGRLIAHGLPAERVQVLPYCLAMPRMRATGGRGRKVVRTEMPYILCFGRLSDEKGVEVAIRAMKYLKGVVLKIAGSGPYEEVLRRVAAEEGVEDRVAFLGFCPPEEVGVLIAEAVLTVMPSVWYEVLPYSITEVFTQGRVVVGSRIGAVEEMIGAVDARLLFTVGDAKDCARVVKYWLSRPALRRSVGMKGRAHYARLMDPKRHYRDLMKIFRGLVC